MSHKYPTIEQDVQELLHCVQTADLSDTYVQLDIQMQMFDIDRKIDGTHPQSELHYKLRDESVCELRPVFGSQIVT